MKEINGISIVVATKGRVRLLEELLQGIDKARACYSKPVEIILVDDSNHADQEQISKLCRKYDARLERYTNTVAMKRNHGVAMSRYNLILFLDSDCNPVEGILNLHEACYNDKTIGAAAGPLEFVGDENRFWKCVTLTPYLICFKMPYWAPTVPWGATANFSVRKDVFEAVGGFSQEFPNKPGGEDVDLGLMIGKAGYTIRSAPEAVVYHAKQTWSAIVPMFKRAWHYGAADYYLAKRHEELTCQAVPRRTVIAAVVFVFCILAAILKGPALLLGIPLWAVLDVLIMSAIMSRIGFEPSPFLRQCVVQLLIITNEIGYVRNCLIHGRPGYIHRQIVYFDNQIKGNVTNGHVTLWRTLMCYLALMAFFLLLL